MPRYTQEQASARIGSRLSRKPACAAALDSIPAIPPSAIAPSSVAPDGIVAVVRCSVRAGSTVPPYEQLMAAIEATGYSAVGRKYGVSDNAIRKWVRVYEREREGGERGGQSLPGGDGR